MTTIQYSKDVDAFRITNEGRTAYLPSNDFYRRIIDQDLIDTARKAMEAAGEVVAVPSKSNARGLKPRAAQKYFVQ
jgi:hypothetical protein